MSTASGGGFVDVPELLSEAVTKQLPAVNEVAIAAADSYFPVKGLQYLIDYVHTTAGLNCDHSIALYDLRMGKPTARLIMATNTNSIFWNPMEPFKFTADMRNKLIYTQDDLDVSKNEWAKFIISKYL